MTCAGETAPAPRRHIEGHGGEPFSPVYTETVPVNHETSGCNPRRRGRVECRSCAVICERVVYPVHCLRSSCPYVYAFQEEGQLYFGCVEKVFSAELDLAPYRASPRGDVYGALKTFREPLRRCRSKVDRAYEFLFSRRACLNPTFAHHTHEFSPEAIEYLVHGSGGRARPAGPGEGPGSTAGETPGI